MLLRNSISTTKKFFQKSLQNFRYFLFSTASYQRIPNSSPYNNPCSYTHLLAAEMNLQTTFDTQDFDTFSNDFKYRQDTVDEGKAKKRNSTKRIPPSSSSAKQENDELRGSFIKFSKAIPAKNYQIKRGEDNDYKNYQIKRGEDNEYTHKKKVDNGFQEGGKRWQQNSSRDEGKSWLVAQKLKELEMMDISNVDHVLDIEEVLHYYSRLTCPAYLDIVDKFFMEIYAEFLGSPGTLSRGKLRFCLQ